LRGYYPGEREYRDRQRRRRRRPRLDQPIQIPRLSRAPPQLRAERRERAEPGRGRRFDWALGILIGILLGIAVVVAFLVLGSEDTIDAPSVNGGKAQPAREAPRVPPEGE
jgi:hypothetical protein